MIRSRYVRLKVHQLLGMLRIQTPPVDVHEIAEKLGFNVLEHDFPDETSAVMFIEEGVRAIGVNQYHAPVRQRFSIAHELGHYLAGHEDLGEIRKEKIHVDGRFDFTDPQHRQEQEANEFAAELLMPEPFLRRDLEGIGLDVPALAKRYRVSEQAMWIQLIDHQLASQYGEL